MNLALMVLGLALAQVPEPADAGVDPGSDASVAAPAPQAAMGRELDSILGTATTSAPPAAQAASLSALGAGWLQHLNLDLSVVLDAVAGWSTARPISPSTDDPFLGGDVSHPMGATVQELEIGLQSTVDRYFSANVFLTLPNQTGLVIDEAYAQTLCLPWDLQLKAGVFRSSAGIENEQHLHLQDFSRRPLASAAYLGPGGLRGPGAQLAWQAPVPFGLRLAAEAFSLDRGSSTSFGGALRTAPTFVATAKSFFGLTESLSILFGLTGATGHAWLDAFPQDVNGPRTWLAGADLYIQWRASHTSEGTFEVALQAEYYWRYTDRPIAPGVSYFREPDAYNDGGFYAQLTAQLARRWQVGFRYDYLGAPTSNAQERAERATVMAMFTPSGFSRIRLQGSRVTQPTAADTWEVLLALELSVGAHGGRSL